MNIYVSQLKKSISQKLENVNDADYLATLDAILTYETISSDGKIPQSPAEKKSPGKRLLSFFFLV
jgi:hypothetical protein